MVTKTATAGIRTPEELISTGAEGTSISSTYGWRAEIALGFAATSNRSCLANRRRRGPLVVQKPLYPEGDEVCHVILLHPPGGIVGGDQLQIELNLATGAHALITTPGSSKFYRSQGDNAVQRQMFAVSDQATLEWLPQDAIFFSGCRAEVNTCVELETNATFIGTEMTCLGRPASNDHFEGGRVTQRISIQRDGKPLLKERALYQSGHELLTQSWGLGGRSIVGTLYATPATREMLGPVRHYLAESGGDERCAVTYLDNVLVFRCLSDNAERCRMLLTGVWQVLRPLIIGRAPCVPRIWLT